MTYVPSISANLTTSRCQLQQKNNKTLHGLLISSPQVISVGSLSRDPFGREVTKYLSVNLDSPLSYGIPDTTEELPCSLLTLKHTVVSVRISSPSGTMLEVTHPRSFRRRNTPALVLAGDTRSRLLVATSLEPVSHL